MIHIGGKIFSNKQLFDSNIRLINDNIEEDGTFLTMLVFAKCIHMSRLISKNMQALFMPLRLLLKTQLATETLKNGMSFY